MCHFYNANGVKQICNTLAQQLWPLGNPCYRRPKGPRPSKHMHRWPLLTNSVQSLDLCSTENAIPKSLFKTSWPPQNGTFGDNRHVNSYFSTDALQSNGNGDLRFDVSDSRRFVSQFLSSGILKFADIHSCISMMHLCSLFNMYAKMCGCVGLAEIDMSTLYEMVHDFTYFVESAYFSGVWMVTHITSLL